MLFILLPGAHRQAVGWSLGREGRLQRRDWTQGTSSRRVTEARARGVRAPPRGRGTPPGRGRRLPITRAPAWDTAAVAMSMRRHGCPGRPRRNLARCTSSWKPIRCRRANPRRTIRCLVERERSPRALREILLKQQFSKSKDSNPAKTRRQPAASKMMGQKIGSWLLGTAYC